jgi:hypothetical protein
VWLACDGKSAVELDPPLPNREINSEFPGFGPHSAILASISSNSFNGLQPNSLAKENTEFLAANRESSRTTYVLAGRMDEARQSLAAFTREYRA